MKKLLLPLTFICLLVSANTVAQQTKNTDDLTAKNIQKQHPETSKNTALICSNEASAKSSTVLKRSKKNTAKKQRMAKTRNSNRKAIKKISHREMIAKRKRIVGNY